MIKVKQLEWVDGAGHFSGSPEWFAHAETGMYVISKNDYGYVFSGSNSDKGFRETFPEAKAACQADYEKRILSTLEPSHTDDPWKAIESAPLREHVLVARTDGKLPIMAKRYARGWAFFGAPKQDIYWLTGDEAPTHWMLLPNPPEVKPLTDDDYCDHDAPLNDSDCCPICDAEFPPEVK